MPDSEQIVKKNHKKIISIAAVLAVSAGIAVPIAREYGARLAEDPERAPPQVQIRNQTKKLLEKRSKIVIPDSEIGFVLPPGLDQDELRAAFVAQATPLLREYIDSPQYPGAPRS